MSFRFPQPANEDDFELTCLRFLRHLWKCKSLNQYGKRGERQFGIDLIDESGGTPMRAVQCKHHEQDKTIPPSEIQAEVDKALAAPIELDEYYILTTGRKTTHGQNAIIRINRDHQARGKFKVFLLTWADIETELSAMDDIAQDRVLRGDSGRSAPALMNVMSAVLADHLDKDFYSSASELDRELEIIKDAIDRHETEAAESKLKELGRRAEGALQARHQYQLRVLRFRILAHRWEWTPAGRELLDAKRFLSTEERARINEALGYELVGEKQKAHELATALRDEFPNAVRVRTIWIRTAPESVDFEEIVRVAAGFEKEDEELNLAVAHRAALADRFSDAMPYAWRATEIDSDSPQAWFVLAQAEHSASFSTATGFQRDFLSKAEGHYTRAGDLARRQRLSGLLAAALFHRGKVKHLLGRPGAEADFVAAVEYAAPDQDIRTEYGGFLVELERFEEALAYLANPSESECGSGHRLFYEAAARYGRNKGDDRAQAVALLRKIISSPESSRWAEAHILLVQWSIGAATQADAKLAISTSGIGESNPLVYHCLQGWLLFSQGDSDSARREYRTAADHAAAADSRKHLFLLAQALVAVGDDAAAFPLLERCYRRGVFDHECRKLLDCARRLQRHDTLSAVCRELRESGEADRRVVLEEISVLQMYDPKAALRVAVAYQTEHPGDRHVTLWQSTLALRLERSEHFVAELSRLPGPDEVTPQGAGLVINILREADRPSSALQYAYDALRAHFGEEFAHGQFIARFLELSPRCAELQDAGTVKPGVAVCYRGEHDGADRWVVIEDGEADLSLDEVPPSHPTAVALSGGRPGDRVVLSDSGIQPREVTIREVVHRHVYRLRDCTEKFRDRFPRGTACQMVHVGGDDGFDPSPILRGLTKQKERIEALDYHYRTQPVPLSCYARLVGGNEFDAWEHLVSTPGLGIRMFDGKIDGLRLGLEQVKRCKRFVLDPTSIITLAQLGMLQVLESRSREWVVAQTTMDWLQTVVESGEPDQRSPGMVYLRDDGQLGMMEVSAEQRAVRLAFLENVRDRVRINCQVVPCIEAAKLDPEKRRQLTDVIGRHNLDTLLLAAAPDMMMWTDDLILGVVARTDFGTLRAWTQAVLFVLLSDGAITATTYDTVVAKLVGWNYHGVLWNAGTILAAATLADWHTGRWPMPAVMKGLGNGDANPIERLQIASEAIRAAWAASVSPLLKQGFLFAILAGLGSKNLACKLRGHVSALFGIDAVSAVEVADLINYWLKHPTARL